MLGCTGNYKDYALQDCDERNPILLIRLDYLLLILYPRFIQINVFVFLFYPILDYSFSYEHFNTPSSIGQPRKPISNGLHQEYSSSFWLWLYTGKNRNHWFILLQGGTCCFTLIYWNIGGFWKMVMERSYASITSG